jgi:hypothetical protein
MAHIMLRLSQFFFRIILRQEPHAILSWRYFLPNQDAMVHLHRQTFLGAWAGFPRVIWCLIAVYSYTLWYLLHSWTQVYSIWKKRSARLFRRQHIARYRQALDLLMLALLHSTPPVYYYRYRLYLYPESQWLNFIYTHELPHWHHMMSANASKENMRLMNDKQAFSIAMMQRTLPAIATIYDKLAEQKFPQEQLFSQRSLFIKPNIGSRKEGCYALYYQPEGGSYQLQGDADEGGFSAKKITLLLDQVTLSKHYLLQPLLENHLLLGAHFKTTDLIVIRLVTCVCNRVPKSICAQLEVPVEGQFQLVNTYTIHIDSGALVADLGGNDERAQRTRAVLPFFVPEWLELRRIAEQAHGYLLDIHSIGWDMAITPRGVQIIEGNFNWGVAAHQRQGPQFAV